MILFNKDEYLESYKKSQKWGKKLYWFGGFIKPLDK